MPHYHAKVWIHLITATKNRSLLIEPSVEQEIYSNMQQELLLLGCPTDVINGMPDHVHSLFLLNPKHALSAVIQQVKGSTSHRINDRKLLPENICLANRLRRLFSKRVEAGNGAPVYPQPKGAP